MRLLIGGSVAILPTALLAVVSPIGNIDYRVSFSEEVLKQAANIDTNANLAPMLDVGITVPNSGIHRFFPGEGWKRGNIPRLVKLFSESPYQVNAPLRVSRVDWNFLESDSGEYLFDKNVEPLFIQCVREHSRLHFGLPINVGDRICRVKHEGRALCVPKYIFDGCAREGHPFRTNNTYNATWVPDYDSPYFHERFRAILKAFAGWIEGNVTGTNIRRRDVLQAIELRYIGWWGEGSLPRPWCPKTGTFESYADDYVEIFPTIPLLSPLLAVSVYSPSYVALTNNLKLLNFDNDCSRRLKFVRHFLQLRNQAGYAGGFLDCWQAGHRFSGYNAAAVLDDKGNPCQLTEWLNAHWFGKRYFTGEFAYFETADGKVGREQNLKPYAALYHNFSAWNVSGLSTHNFSIVGSKIVNGKRSYIDKNGNPFYLTADDIPPECYEFGGKCVSMLGYRFVLGSPKVERVADGVKASFTLTNIGVSRMFYSQHHLHLRALDKDGKLIEDRSLDFDLTSLAPAKVPLRYRESEGAKIEATLPANTVSVELIIPDRQGIEYPLCLSNYGRRADGSYLLGRTDTTRQIKVTEDFWLLPIDNTRKIKKVEVDAFDETGVKLASFAWALAAKGDGDWTAAVDVRKWKCKTVTLKLKNSPNNDIAWLERIRPSATAPTTAFDEPDRLKFHFTPPRGWMNDPNGLAYIDGEWRLFYQHAPFAVRDPWGSNFCWGYATSKDLIHWTHHGDAVFPYPGTRALISGSGVIDKNNTAGFGRNAHILCVCGSSPKGGGLLLWSSTDGRNYTPYAGNPVCASWINNGPLGADPKVIWHEPTKRWIMVTHTVKDNCYCVVFSSSPDLKHWQWESDYYGEHTSKGRRRFLFECPGLEELKIEGTDETAWVVWCASVQYAIGQFDGHVFKPSQEHLLTLPKRGQYADSYYAGQSFQNVADGRCIFMPWYLLTPHKSQHFNQALGLPVELGLKRTNAGLRMTRKPVRELEALRDGEAMPLAEFRGELAEIALSAELSESGVINLDLRGVKLSYDAKRERLFLRGGDEVHWPLQNGRLELRLFLDVQGLEAFSNDGLLCWPFVWAQANSTNQSLSITTEGEVKNLKTKAWRLKAAPAM